MLKHSITQQEFKATIISAKVALITSPSYFNQLWEQYPWLKSWYRGEPIEIINLSTKKHEIISDGDLVEAFHAILLFIAPTSTEREMLLDVWQNNERLRGVLAALSKTKLQEILFNLQIFLVGNNPEIIDEFSMLITNTAVDTTRGLTTANRAESAQLHDEASYEASEEGTGLKKDENTQEYINNEVTCPPRKKIHYTAKKAVEDTGSNSDKVSSTRTSQLATNQTEEETHKATRNIPLRSNFKDRIFFPYESNRVYCIPHVGQSIELLYKGIRKQRSYLINCCENKTFKLGDGSPVTQELLKDTKLEIKTVNHEGKDIKAVVMTCKDRDLLAAVTISNSRINFEDRVCFDHPALKGHVYIVPREDQSVRKLRLAIGKQRKLLIRWMQNKTLQQPDGSAVTLNSITNIDFCTASAMHNGKLTEVLAMKKTDHDLLAFVSREMHIGRLTKVVRTSNNSANASSSSAISNSNASASAGYAHINAQAALAIKFSLLKNKIQETQTITHEPCKPK